MDDHQETESPLRQRGKRLVSSASGHARAGYGWTARWSGRILGERPMYQRVLLIGLFGFAVLLLPPCL